MSSQKKNKNNKKEGRSSGPSHGGNICNQCSINTDSESKLEIHKKENERLKKENEKLIKENQVLKEENMEILRENEQLKQEKQKLKKIAERKTNVNNRIPENDEMEIETVSCFEDTQVSTQNILQNSANLQTVDEHTSYDSCYLGTASANQDVHYASKGIVHDDRFESEPNKEQSWSSDTESELKNASGNAVSMSKRTQEKNWDSRYGKEETQNFPRQQKQNTGYNKHCNETYGYDYGHANEQTGNRKPSGGPDRRQPDRFERGRGNAKQFLRTGFSKGNQQRYDGNKEQYSKLNFSEKDGDLFAAPEDNSLAHCVAEDLRMGSGIAVQFKQLFKNVGELLGQRKKVGQVAVLPEKGRFIYYLITKKHSTGKPRLSDLQDALEDMKKHVQENQVKNIAIPRLGCGLDRLHWADVRQLLKKIFAEVDVTITAYNFIMGFGKDVIRKKAISKNMELSNCNDRKRKKSKK